MTTKTLNGREILAVEVNASANNLKVSPAGWLIGYLTLQKLPQGQWSILGRAGEITEEQAMGLGFSGGKKEAELWFWVNGINENDLLIIKNS